MCGIHAVHNCIYSMHAELQLKRVKDYRFSLHTHIVREVVLEEYIATGNRQIDRYRHKCITCEWFKYNTSICYFISVCIHNNIFHKEHVHVL